MLSVLGWALGFVVTAGVSLLITRLQSVMVRDLLFGGLTGLTAGRIPHALCRLLGRWTSLRCRKE